MKNLTLILILLMFIGCSIKSKSYYLLEGSKQIVQTHPKPATIGIKQIELPRYFDQNNLAIKKGDNRVVFIQDADWISDMDEHLTTVLIAYLKRYFNTTDIFLYPWESSKKIKKIVKIRIDNFIYESGKVTLDATWEIDLNHTTKPKFFHTSVKSGSSSDEIVKAMNEAFSKLEKEIARSLQ